MSNRGAEYWTDKKAWLVLEEIVNQEQYDGGPFDFGESYKDGSLDAVVNSLLAIRDQIPKEYWATARCGIDSVGSWEDTHYARIQVEYLRPATEREIEARKAADKAASEAEDAKERQAYETLKRRFG